MTYFLKRERDGAGDSGQLCEAFWLEGNDIQREKAARPRVGVAIRVGVLGSRSYGNQDYWTTTPITEILEESENYVKFKTGNSVYIWEIN